MFNYVSSFSFLFNLFWHGYTIQFIYRLYPLTSIKSELQPSPGCTQYISKKGTANVNILNTMHARLIRANGKELSVRLNRVSVYLAV